MFVRLASVRLKMAETALEDGRLNEAFELANAADLRDHRRAQKVLCRLTDRFRERAERHAADGRYAEALTDLKKAEAPGVRLEEIAAQREQVLSTMQRVRRHEADRRATLEAAGAKIDAGSLAGGNGLLDRVDAGSDVDRLRGHAEEREVSVRRAINETRRLLETDRLVAAAEALRKAKTLYPRAEGLLEIEATLCDAFVLRVGGLIDSGSVSRASDELKVLGDLGRTLPARHELETILSVSAEAASALDDRRVSDAITALRRLSHLAPKANWVSSALEQLVNAQQSLDVVVSGPLGSMPTNGYVAPTVVNAEPRGATHGPDALTEAQTVAVGALPERLLVSVDAGGSYLLVRSPRVTIGRAGIGSTADVPVLADVSDRHLEIARVGEDYFLFARHPVEVGGQRVTQKLLQDGDRIRVGRRGRLTFRQPSRMSASAVLDLGEGLRTVHDVRRVILFDRHALIGPHRRCHIAAKGAEMTLFERGGRLFLRDAENGQAVGGSRAPARAVPLGQYVGVGGTGLSIRPWSNQPSGSGLAGEARNQPGRA